jgi:hypothetical protein
MRNIAPIRTKTLVKLDLTQEQAAALRRVLKSHKTTADTYARTIMLSALESDDKKYGNAQMARSLGLPATSTATQIRDHLKSTHANR